MNLDVECNESCFIIDNLKELKFEQLTLYLNTILDIKSIMFNHIFGHEKTAIECFKWYHRINPLRPILNMNMVNYRDVNVNTSIEINFGDINRNFKTTTKQLQREFLTINVSFLTFIKSLHFILRVSFINDSVVVKPEYNVFYTHNPNHIEGLVFSKFINFLQLHSTVLTKSLLDHYNVRKFSSNLKYIDYQGKYVLTSSTAQELSIDWIDVSLMVENLNLSKIFGKFYEG